MKVRMVDSMVHEGTTRQWFSYNFIITTIDGMMMFRAAIVVIARQAIRIIAIDVVIVANAIHC